MLRLACLIVLCASLLSCGPRASSGDFDSDNPAAKLYAIHNAGEARDRSKIPKLVEQLDSDDEAVRMWSIYALKRITSQTLGYDPVKPAAERRPAIEAWEQAVRDGRFAK